jgi:hypothetical protein
MGTGASVNAGLAFGAPFFVAVQAFCDIAKGLRI